MGGGDSFRGIPVQNPTTSYWQVPPSDLARHRTTQELPTTADYVIVGSGITGAGVALRLLSHLGAEGSLSPSQSQSHATVLMLEARTTSSGATGRNGGHCRAGWWAKFSMLHDLFGAHEAIKFDRFEQNTVSAVAAFVHENKIDCDFKDVEAADVMIADKDWNAALATWKLRYSYEKDFNLAPRKVLIGEEAIKHTKITGAKGAVVYDGHTLNPYKLVVGIIRLCLGKGLNLQTSTSVLSVERANIEQGVASNGRSETSSLDEFPWCLKTERGPIRAKNVILATNAYTNALYSSLADQKFLTPTRAQVVAIRPGDPISGNPILRRSVGIDGGVAEDYMASSTTGLSGKDNVIYGGGRLLSHTKETDTIDDATIHPVIADYLKNALPTYFGREQWGEQGTVLREWTGIMGFTRDQLPLVGEAPGKKGLWLAAGFNGHGMALSFKCTQALVGMIVGIDNGNWPEWLPQAFRLERVWGNGEASLASTTTA